MAIKRGTRTISRVNAKNFTQDIAQRRLDETVAPFNRQVENSLAVDGVEVDYYSIQQRVGVPCTCEKTAVLPLGSHDYDTGVAPVIPHKHSDNSGIKLKFQDDDVFGESIAEKVFNDAADEVIDVTGERHTHFEEIDDGPQQYDDTALGGGSVNCGICYRTGMVPPYKAYGKQRFLFTNYEVADIDGFFLDSTEQPHKFKAHSIGQGWVKFKTIVPKYFAGVTFSVRDNIQYLPQGKLFNTDGTLLGLRDFKAHAGRALEFLVKASQFTHVVIEFDLSVPKIIANISAEQMALDYERLTTISDINVILPPSLSEVEPGDVIIIKKRNLALKVRDKERKITASTRRLEWSVSTRVLQPTEALRLLAYGFKLY